MTTSNIMTDGGTERPRSPADKHGCGTKWEEFQSILEGIVSEQGCSPFPPKPTENQVKPTCPEGTVYEKSSSRDEVVSLNRPPRDSQTSPSADQQRNDVPGSRTGTPVVVPNREGSLSIPAVPYENGGSAAVVQINVGGTIQPLPSPHVSGKALTEGIGIIKTVPQETVPSDSLVRDMAKQDGGLIQIFAGQELQKDTGEEKGRGNPGRSLGAVELGLSVEEPRQILAGFGTVDDESGNQGKTDDDEVLNALRLSASKKYGVFAEERGVVSGKTVEKVVDQPSQNTNLQAVQYHVFDAFTPQVRDDSAVFEHGSFSSFLQERIEKIVEQYSDRKTGTDMVVRLKLDDQETILVGLKHNNDTLLVEVKASNEGLVNLLQSHKDDIERSLEDKNIFTEIYVDPEGERNFERRDQRGSGARGRRRDGVEGFGVLLDTNA